MTAKSVLIAIGVVALGIAFAYAGTYAAYFLAAMRHPPASPFTIACRQVGAASRRAVRVRFDVANAAAKEATYLNFALFAQSAGSRNLSDWNYALQTHVPARGSVSTIVAIALPPDYAGLHFAGVRCNLINAAFADGSQQEYAADTTSFP